MLTFFQTNDRTLSLLQTSWMAQLNPVLSAPLVNGRIIASVALTTGSNTIDHGLGRAPLGWLVIRQRDAYSEIYDTQDENPIPSSTLLLNSSADVTVDLFVF